MKKRFASLMLIIVGLLFLTNTDSFGQNNPDLGQKIKFQLNKFFDFTGDSQKGNDDILKVRKRIKLQDGSRDGDGFVDVDGDGFCDKGEGSGDLDRIRAGKFKKYKGGM